MVHALRGAGFTLNVLLAIGFSVVALPVAQVLHLLRIWSPMRKYTLKAIMEERLCEGKVCLVTGSNTGIGFATAKLFAASGATVILACRSKEKAEKAARQIVSDLQAVASRTSGASPVASKQVITMELDLSDLRSVNAFVEQLKREFSALDILVNNAGIGATIMHTLNVNTILRCVRSLAAGIGDVFAPKRTPQGIELVWGTNFVGPFHLTLSLLDHLQKSKRGRSLNLSSGNPVPPLSTILTILFSDTSTLSFSTSLALYFACSLSPPPPFLTPTRPRPLLHKLPPSPPLTQSALSHNSLTLNLILSYFRISLSLSPPRLLAHPPSPRVSER